jgi:hypothetical protein
MATSKARNVDHFLNENDSVMRPALMAFRKIMKATSPKTKESMQYGMPTYSLLDKPFAAFNVEKHHLAVYILDEELLTARKNDVGPVEFVKGLHPLAQVRELQPRRADRDRERIGRAAPEGRGDRRGPMPRSAPKNADGTT